MIFANSSVTITLLTRRLLILDSASETVFWLITWSSDISVEAR